MNDYGEPWEIIHELENLPSVVDRNGKGVADVRDDVYARRIVALATACAGMRTEDLEEVVAARATVAFPAADVYKRLAEAERLLRRLVNAESWDGVLPTEEQLADAWDAADEARTFLKERIDA